jgi:hypothetical protein
MAMGPFRLASIYRGWGDAVAVGDVNGDGKLDLVAGGTGGFDVLLGNGDGTFATPLFTGSNLAFNQIVIQDVNGDGKPDLLSVFDGLVVTLGNGDGTFQVSVPYSLSLGTHALALATGDFNGDGKTDVSVANDGLQPVSLFYGKRRRDVSGGTELSLFIGVRLGDFGRRL